jgi:hypothetical protein
MDLNKCFYVFIATVGHYSLHHGRIRQILVLTHLSIAANHKITADCTSGGQLPGPDKNLAALEEKESRKISSAGNNVY